jgi:cathepsin B
LIGEKTKGLHAVKIYGWGQTEPEDGGPPVKFWKVANSWGNEWGNRGTFKIKKGVDESGIEKTGIWFGKPRV